MLSDDESDTIVYWAVTILWGVILLELIRCAL